ncbi:MAG TPA: glycosyltransferase [Burkholderiaceae bacterium]|nr:glycosyltransferase [Burkholderiaceae bacterium]
MFDYEMTLAHALKNVDGERVVLALPYDLPQRICHDLVVRNLVQGVIADSVDSARLDPSCAGWWVDRDRDHIHFRRGVAATALIAGVDRSRRAGPRLLLEARLKGVRRIVITDRMGEVVEDLQVDAALIERIEDSNAQFRLTGPTYEQAFEEMYELVADKLRLPARSFNPDRLAMYLGSLGPGGAERQCANTSVGISEGNRWDPYIVCDNFDPPADFFRPYVEGRGIKVVQVNDSPPELSDPDILQIYNVLGEKYSALNFDNVFAHIVRYASLLRTIRPALVHCWMDYCNTLAGTAAVMVGVPSIVLSCRSLAPDHFRIFQPYMRPAYRALLKRRPAVVLNNSQAGAIDYARWLAIPKDCVRVIHNGFQFPDPISPQSRLDIRKRYAISGSVKVVGSILRFSEEKRPRLLIDMAKELHAADDSLRFLFFGGGVLLQDMRAYVASLDLEDVIHLPGVTNTPWEVLAAMDLFVLTSRMEGLPNVLVEAQASGLPIVCTRVGGTTETFVENETGVSVPDATASSLAAVAGQILQDNNLHARMSARATMHARKVFGIRPMIDATLKAYAHAERHADQPLMARAAA